MSALLGAVNVYIELLVDPDPRVRLAGADRIVDRVLGKLDSSLALTGAGGGPVEGRGANFRRDLDPQEIARRLAEAGAIAVRQVRTEGDDGDPG